MVEPKTLAGFMELLPADQIQFNRFLDIIRKNFEKFGFLPIDTPVLEISEVLLAKAGGETDKQIYSFKKGDGELCMRFDLTVPLAKYVAKNLNQLNFPFLRYQIGKVYRGERPQKGRFREFYQCDIDVIGKGLLDIKYDALVPSVMYNIFKEMNIGDFCISVSNRKILFGFLNYIGLNEKSQEILRLIDKYKKIDKENFIATMSELNIADENIQKIIDFITISGDKWEKIEKLKSLNIQDETYKEGVSELEQVIKLMSTFGVGGKFFDVDLLIARGLDYYTGTVYETELVGYESLGSICSGGRYDNLAGYYTNEKLPGIGMSIGLTRLFVKLKENDILAKESGAISSAIILPMGDTLTECIKLSNTLRENDIHCEVYLQDVKFKHKISYAGKSGIKYAILVGEDEVNNGEYSIKNLIDGSQQKLGPKQLIEFLKN